MTANLPQLRALGHVLISKSRSTERERAMVLKLEYDSWVRRLNRATVAVFAVLLLVPAMQAQLNGGPPSVTSNGFGGSTGSRGIPPSVTSRGFGAPGRAAPMPPTVTSLGFSRNNPRLSTGPASSRHEHHNGDRHPRRSNLYAVPYYYNPYAYDGDESAPADDAAEEDQYQGGPTIFDRRGSGTSQHARFVDDDPAPRAPALQADDDPVSNQPDTVLIFKDGRQIEVANYAIVGGTLFDLSEGHHQKIPLSELNLTATAKENDDRGIDFQVPAVSRVN
jgi:hypothetical protein